MKKFTFLLTLLALVLGNVQSAFADKTKWTDKIIKSISDPITNLDELTDGFYVIRNVGRKTFVHLENNGNIWLQAPVRSENTTEIQAAFANKTDVAYAFYVAKDKASDKYTIQAKSGKYFPESLPHGSTASVNETAGNYTIEKITDGQFALKASNYYADGNGINGSPYTTGSFTGWNALKDRPGANANGAYQFYKVTMEESYTINYHYNVKGHEVLLVRGVKYGPGATPSAEVYPCLTINGYDKEGTITESGDITVNCTMDLPMKASTVEDPKYYAVNMHTGIRKWGANNDGTISCLDVANNLTELPDNNQWAFIGKDLLDNFKIYNKGTGKYLKSTGSDAATLTDDVNEATSFKVKATRIQNMTNGFCISREDTYLNYQDNSIKTWNDNDQGSTCTIFTPESFPMNFASLYVNAPEGAICGNAYLETAGKLTALKNAYNAVESNASVENINALTTINKAIASSEVGTQITEGYYRLVNHQDKKFLHINGNNIMNTQAEKAKAVGSVVYFKKANEEGQFNLMIEGKYLGTVTRSQNINLGDDSNKGSYTVTCNNFTTKIQEVSTTDDADYHYLHVNNGNAVGWEANNATASHWYIIPATDIEVAMKAVEGKTFASVYLPFDVKAVTGAEAYVGTFNNDKSALNMNKVGGVPAGKGFVLVGSADKATLAIGTANSVESDLTGTLVTKAIAEGEQTNYLVFGKDKDSNAVGFYAPSASVTSIPANKAYLNASALSAAAIALNFNGTATGVNTVVLGENGVNAPVFDLSGRRVVAPVKGGVYIQNGKKFIK